jgi:H/ACA ribonucleoprotein complex subunit 4
MTQLPFEQVKREILTRKEAETSEKYGCSPEKRKADDLINLGIVNINKPKGPTSHQVSAYVQKILGLKKAGHSGTLDPNVIGVLPIALGRATRVVQTLLTAGKEYVCLMHLHKKVDEILLKETLKSFVGKIEQLPPIKSSVKRRLRQRSIYYLEILEIQNQDVLFRVGCQAGTYIRKLCHDIGQRLGCGAHMVELIRTKAGPFDDKNMFTLQELTDAFYYYIKEGNDLYLRTVIKPCEAAITHLPKVWVLDTTIDSLCHGADLAVPGISKVESDIKEGDMVAVLSLKGELICIGTARMDSKKMLGKKGIAVKTEKVFMLPGTYPSIKRQN